jgi:hypothetical protein
MNLYKVADFEPGRFEYTGVTRETFAFYLIEPNGNRRLLNDVNKGIGRMRSEICKYIEPHLYKCSKQTLPNLFLDFDKSEVSFLLYRDGKMVAGKLPYRETDNTIEIGLQDAQFVIPKATSPDTLVMVNRVSYSSRPNSVPKFKVMTGEYFGRNYVVEAMVEQQGEVGDTILLYTAYERFAKK